MKGIDRLFGKTCHQRGWSDTAIYQDYTKSGSSRRYLSVPINRLASPALLVAEEARGIIESAQFTDRFLHLLNDGKKAFVDLLNNRFLTALDQLA